MKRFKKHLLTALTLLLTLIGFCPKPANTESLTPESSSNNPAQIQTYEVDDDGIPWGF